MTTADGPGESEGQQPGGSESGNTATSDAKKETLEGRTSEHFSALLDAGFALAKEAAEGVVGDKVSDVVGWASGGRLGAGSSAPNMGMPTQEQLNSLHDKAQTIRKQLVKVMGDTLEIFDQSAQWVLDVTKPKQDDAPSPAAAPAETAESTAGMRDEVAAARAASGSQVSEASAGQTIRVPFLVRNPRWQQLGDVQFVTRGLFGPGDAPPIPPDNIEFSQKSVMLGPREARNIEAIVTIPEGAAPGPYFGTVSIAGAPGARYFLAIEVT